MAERKMLSRKRRSLHQLPIVRLKRASDELPFPNLKRHSHLFPLNSKDNAVKCLQALISPVDAEPDLTLISLVLGALESVLTTADAAYQDTSEPLEDTKFPPVKFEDIKLLYHNFYQHLKAQHPSTISNESSNELPVSSRRSQIRMIADKVWILLARSYRKDKLRMQYLYSLLTDQKLDSFGVTSSVVAACQLLGLDDVNMVLSEDHSWIEFGEPDCRESMEVTWHGKCTEDKRGTPIKGSENKWIYSANSPVRCSPRMTAALLASQLNPCIDGELKSPHLLTIKRELMWFLHKEKLLHKLPMALIELAKLEMSLPKTFASKSPEREGAIDNGGRCLELLEEAIDVGRESYENRFVYPHLELGEYFYRTNQGSRAFHCWANAADIISLYSYGKEDEEVYKRFYEVANDSFISLLKKDLISSQMNQSDCSDESIREEKSEGKHPLCQSPQGFADFLRFYDGMCCWEEGSPTPVLHVKWAQSMYTALIKFHTRVRTVEVDIKCSKDGSEATEENAKESPDYSTLCTGALKSDENPCNRNEDRDNKTPKTCEVTSQKANESQEIPVAQEVCLKPLKACNTHKPGNIGKRKRGFIDMGEFEKDEHENPVNNENDQSLNTFEEFEREISRKFGISKRAVAKESDNPMLEVLSKNCSSSIFNPEFFQGRGEPFLKFPIKAGMHSSLPSESKLEKSLMFEQPGECVVNKGNKKVCEYNLHKNNHNLLISSELESPVEFPNQKDVDSKSVSFPPSQETKKVVVLLKSSKMKTLRDLLVLEKLNSQAIKLQLTAQSNTTSTKNKTSLPSSCPGERMAEREHPEGLVPPPCGVLAPMLGEGEAKIVRRALRNRIGK